ncbi:MAG: MBL fold metallo-hydrolase [Halodesulfurarchaeum sp.]
MIERFEIPVSEPAPTGHTNAYLLEGASLLVDPAGSIDEFDRSPGPVEHVAVTHTHPDHVGGVKELAERFGTTVWARAGREADFESATGVVPDATFREGDTIGDSGTVRVIETPGHAPEHVSFAVDGAILIGDLAMAGDSIWVGEPDGDVRAYLGSLRRIRTMDFDVAYPGHGQPITTPRQRLERIIRHRLERERRIEEAVLDGRQTPEEIVEAAYDSVPSEVRDLAIRSVRSHLEKLVVEDRIRWDGAVAGPGEDARRDSPMG